MKIGFSKGELRFNSKKFDPLNMGIKGLGIESNASNKPVNGMKLLEDLSLMKVEKATKLDKMKGLGELIDKINK